MIPVDVLNIVSRYSKNHDMVHFLATCKKFWRLRRKVCLWEIEDFQPKKFKNFLFVNVRLTKRSDGQKIPNKVWRIVCQNKQSSGFSFTPKMLVLDPFLYNLKKGDIPEGVEKLVLIGKGRVKEGAIPDSVKILKIRGGIKMEGKYPKKLESLSVYGLVSPQIPSMNLLPKTLKSLHLRLKTCPKNLPGGLENLRVSDFGTFIPEKIKTLVLDMFCEKSVAKLFKNLETLILKEDSWIGLVPPTVKTLKICTTKISHQLRIPPSVENLIIDPCIKSLVIVVPKTVKYIEMGKKLSSHLKAPKTSVVIVK